MKAPHLLRGSTGVAIAVLVLGGMALPLPIRAQDSQPTIQELQKEIRQRDELIRSWCIASCMKAAGFRMCLVGSPTKFPPDLSAATKYFYPAGRAS